MAITILGLRFIGTADTGIITVIATIPTIIITGISSGGKGALKVANPAGSEAISSQQFFCVAFPRDMRKRKTPAFTF
jgi:hypothetical protein